MLGLILLIIGLAEFTIGCIWWFRDWENPYPIILITIGTLAASFGGGIAVATL